MPGAERRDVSARCLACASVRVESVGMDCGAQGRVERVFFLLTLLAYARYAQGVTSGRVASDEETSNRFLPPTRHPSPATRALFYVWHWCFSRWGLDELAMLDLVPVVALLIAGRVALGEG